MPSSASCAPTACDSYFDNVGGDLTDAAMARLAVGARVAVCGQISGYNAEKPEMAPRWLFHLVIKRALVRGFLISDFAERFPEGFHALAGWVRNSRLKYRETVAEGIENAPQAFIGMLGGGNIGKQLVKLAED